MVHQYTNYEFDEDEFELTEYNLPEDVELKVQDGSIPTFQLLKKYQIEKGEPPRAANDTNPNPFPCKRRKSELFKLEDYHEKDEHVKQLTLENPKVNQTWEELADILFEKCTSNLDKVRAAFVFVGTVSNRNPPEDSSAKIGDPYDLARKIKESTNLYSDIFERLIDLGQVPYERLSGLKKGLNCKPGHKLSPGGYWFAVYVEGEFRFVDPFWGSTSIKDYNDGTYHVIDVEAGDIQLAEVSSGRHEYQLNECYFLTDPEEYIVKSFPTQDSKWQLLARPITEAEFLKLHNKDLKQEDIYGMEIVNYPWNVIVVPDSGEIKIHLREAAGLREHLLDLQLHKKSTNNYSKNAIKEKAADENIQKFLRHSRDGSTIITTFTPPCEGKFMITFNIRIIVGVEETENGTITYSQKVEHLKYVIHCPKANRFVKALPDTHTNLSEFGVGVSAQKMGLLSDTPGEVRAIEGEGEIVVAGEKDTELVYSLHGTDQDSSKANVLTWKDDKKSFFRVMATDSGQFVLVLSTAYGKPICQFLVEADAEIEDADFELPDVTEHGGLGFSSDSAFFSTVQPYSHLQPYICTRESELTITWQYPVEVHLSVDLYLAESNQLVLQNSFSFVNYDIENKRGNFKLRFPKPGNYLLKLLIHEERKVVNLYNYLIRYLGYDDCNKVEFPKILSGWNSNVFQLISPVDGVLFTNEITSFRVNCFNDFSGSLFLSEDKNNIKIELTQSKNREFVASIDGKTLHSEQILKLVAHHSSGNDSENEELLEFFVKDPAFKSKTNNNLVELNKNRKFVEAERTQKKETIKRQKDGVDFEKESTFEVEKRIQEQQKFAEREEKRRQKAEMERIAKEKKMELERIAREKKVEQDRVAREQREIMKQRDIRIQKLTKAIQTKDRILLNTSLKDCKNHDDGSYNTRVKQQILRGEVLLDAFELKHKLKMEIQNYKKSTDIANLEALLIDIESRQLSKIANDELHETLKTANEVIEKHNRKVKRRVQHKLNVDAKSLHELRSYNKPDLSIHKTVQVMLLLSGYYEKRTRKWKRCQPLLRKIKQITNFDISTIHPEIAARAEEILDEMSQEHLAQLSAAAIAFYKWSKETISLVKSMLPESERNKFVAADIPTQIVLLNVSIEEDADCDWEDEGIRR